MSNNISSSKPVTPPPQHQEAEALENKGANTKDSTANREAVQQQQKPSADVFERPSK